MVSRGVVDIGKFVERQLSVRLHALVGMAGKFGKMFHSFVIGPRRVTGADSPPPGYELQRAMQRPAPEAVVESLMKISHLPQFIFHPARLPEVFEILERFH